MRTRDEREASCSERRQPSAEPGSAGREPEAASDVRATVLVRPKDGILDPQGEAVLGSLRKLGFDVGSVRVGRVIDVELQADERETARTQLTEMCHQLLANPLIEKVEIRFEEPM